MGQGFHQKEFNRVQFVCSSFMVGDPVFIFSYH